MSTLLEPTRTSYPLGYNCSSRDWHTCRTIFVRVYACCLFYITNSFSSYSCYVWIRNVSGTRLILVTIKTSRSYSLRDRNIRTNDRTTKRVSTISSKCDTRTDSRSKIGTMAGYSRTVFSVNASTSYGSTIPVHNATNSGVVNHRVDTK